MKAVLKGSLQGGDSGASVVPGLRTRTRASRGGSSLSLFHIFAFYFFVFIIILFYLVCFAGEIHVCLFGLLLKYLTSQITSGDALQHVQIKAM